MPLTRFNGKTPILAAVVAFVRNTNRGLEVYLNRRPAHFRYYPDAYVFPGGQYDPLDNDLKATACREVEEEIGAAIDPRRLVLLRETQTSPLAGPVYHMWTFVYPVAGDFRTCINADEIADEVWTTPEEALSQLKLPYQIVVALRAIAKFSTTEDLMRTLSKRNR
ncbi:MAG: NUDIX domain-containing protein [Acidobacteria bacterium]|nr:NUDIX domain-containing protein [Acidobacteriota bacterium]MBI3656979.1 NUDIX domain-containing protein [Acidobacteriota bacterium]